MLVVLASLHPLIHWPGALGADASCDLIYVYIFSVFSCYAQYNKWKRSTKMCPRARWNRAFPFWCYSSKSLVLFSALFYLPCSIVRIMFVMNRTGVYPFNLSIYYLNSRMPCILRLSITTSLLFVLCAIHVHLPFIVIARCS